MTVRKRKRCGHCGKNLSFDKFYVRKSTNSLHTYCKVCSYERYRHRYEKYRAKPENRERARRRTKAWTKANPDRVRSRHLRRKYGITQERYDELLRAQKGCCAICGARSPGSNRKVFNVDHNHRTGAVRGLLCGFCNRGIGNFKDSALLLKSAFKYLEGHDG